MSTKTPNDKSEQLTILRIKRKRTEEPLDALLVHQENEKRIKKTNEKETKSVLTVSATALPTLFRLAETVEQKSFSNLDEAKKLKDRISRRIQPGTSRPQTPTSIEERKDRLVQNQKENASKARYRVINQKRNIRSEDVPPVVQSSSEIEAKNLFQVYEAVKEDENSKKPKLFIDDDIEDPDDIMCNFIPMVKEYLTLNDRQEEEEKEEDYVYDVYYRDDENVDESMKSMNVGSLVWFENESEYLDDDSDSELGDLDDEDSNAEDYYQNDYPDEEESDEFEDQYNYDLSSEDEDYSL